ncbi:MAG: PLP-dependent transferase [candidate division NC10 bacterium]|nr:PLP-dependent transferase [candidate division NC10 bacterium]
MRFETLAVHAGHSVDPASGAIAPPLVLSTTFERAPDGTIDRYFYSRLGNPNRTALEACLTALEGGAAAAAFASGAAATLSILQALSPGDHVVAPLDAYHGTTIILRDILGPWGLAVSFVDMTDPAEVARAVRPRTRMVWVESPSNPLLRVSDIARIAGIAHAGGARCAVDNTWASPALQRPFELGADLILHSTTKYLAGHCDVLSGAVVARTEDEYFQRIRLIQLQGGAVAAPFDCWLVLRGIRTLPYRMRGHCANARQVAEFLVQHPRVEAVHFPGLPSHPGHALAAKQMREFGGMLSFQVRGGKAEALGVTAKLRIILRATSLGGPDTLIEHRASIEPPDKGTPQNLLRLSVGLEHPEDLIEDLAQALG